MRAYEETKAAVIKAVGPSLRRKVTEKSNSRGNWSVVFVGASGEEYVKWIPAKKPNDAHSESVAVVPVLIDCQGDWVSRIYLAYVRTTLRNDVAGEIIRAVYMIMSYPAKIGLSTACRISH